MRRLDQLYMHGHGPGPDKGLINDMLHVHAQTTACICIYACSVHTHICLAMHMHMDAYRTSELHSTSGKHAACCIVHTVMASCSHTQAWL